MIGDVEMVGLVLFSEGGWFLFCVEDLYENFFGEGWGEVRIFVLLLRKLRFREVDLCV